MDDSSRHQGPFIDPPRREGWLRRLFGGSTPQDPSDPTLAHTTPAHTTRPAGTARSMPSFGDAPSTRSSPRRTPLVLIILGWIWRILGVRLIIVIVGLLLVLIGTVGQSGDNLAKRVKPNFSAPIGAAKMPPSPAAANGAEPAGAELVRIGKVGAATVTGTDLSQRRVTFRVPDAAQQKALARNVGQLVVIRWERTGPGPVVATGITVTARSDSK